MGSSASSTSGALSKRIQWIDLLLLFGTFGSFTFADAVGGRFGCGEAAVTTVVLVLLMAVLALGWGWLRQAPPRFRSSLRLSALGILLSVFFFGRWF